MAVAHAIDVEEFKMTRKEVASQTYQYMRPVKRVARDEVISETSRTTATLALALSAITAVVGSDTTVIHYMRNITSIQKSIAISNYDRSANNPSSMHKNPVKHEATAAYAVTNVPEALVTQTKKGVKELDRQRAYQELRNSYNIVIGAFGSLTLLGLIGSLITPSKYLPVTGIFTIMAAGMGLTFFLDYMKRGKA